MLPRRRPPRAPSVPHRTDSSAGGSLTMVKRRSAASAAARGDDASRAPAATSDSAREGVRFQTVSGYPAFKRFNPMGRPMRPRPIHPMLGFEPEAGVTRILLVRAR